MTVEVYGQIKRYKVIDAAKILEEMANEIRIRTNGDGHVLDAEKTQELIFNPLAKKFGVDRMDLYLGKD